MTSGGPVARDTSANMCARVSTHFGEALARSVQGHAPLEEPQGDETGRVVGLVSRADVLAEPSGLEGQVRRSQ